MELEDFKDLKLWVTAGACVGVLWGNIVLMTILLKTIIK